MHRAILKLVIRVGQGAGLKWLLKNLRFLDFARNDSFGIRGFPNELSC